MWQTILKIATFNFLWTFFKDFRYLNPPPYLPIKYGSDMVKPFCIRASGNIGYCHTPSLVCWTLPKLPLILIPKNGKSRFNLGVNAVKNTHYIKRISNKSCSELNFVKESQWAHMSIFPQSGARGFERLIWLKYYILLTLQITFNLALNADKNIESNYQFQNIIIFKTYQSLKPPGPIPWGDKIDICAGGLFCTKFNSEQLLFEAFFFYVIRIFGSIEP